MSWRTLMVLILTGATLAFISTFTRDARRDTSPTPTNVDTEAVHKSSPISITSPSINGLWRAVVGEAGNKVATAVSSAEHYAATRPTGDGKPASFKGLASSTDEVVVQYALALMNGGDYAQARELLQWLISTYPDSKSVAPAFWAMGLSSYEEGGTKNLYHAKECFRDFVVFFGQGPEDLVQAAQIDLAVIDLQLMQSAPTERDRITAARSAASSLKEFLANWPNAPQARAASLSLRDVQDYLSNPR